MRRKIIKQGHNTLTMTLPTKWAKQFNLQAGDEISLKEVDNGLYLNTEKKDEKKKVEIDISGINIQTIWKYFMAVYREGYDEVKVKFNPDENYGNPYKFLTSHKLDLKYGEKTPFSPFETIQQITNRFIGFEIIEHKDDSCIIKDMSELSSKEFDTSLRRVFLLLQQQAEETIEAIEKNNVRKVAQTHDIDINIDKFHDYCIRVLNKTSCKNERQSSLYFTSLYLLEIIGDEFKNIAFHLIKEMENKDLSNLRHMAEMAMKQLNKFYDLFYNFSREKVMEVSSMDKEIYLYLPKLYKKKGKKSTLSDEELEIFNHFRRISRFLNALLELRIEMEY